MDEQQAVQWIAEVFEDRGGGITPTTARADIPGWDSLGTLTLIAAFDEKFNLSLSQQEIDAMKRVDDILQVLRRNCLLTS